MSGGGQEVYDPYASLSASITEAANIQAGAAREAGKIMQGIADKNIQVLQQQTEQARADLAPYRAAGLQASGLLSTLLGTAPGSTTPIYATPSGGSFTLNGQTYTAPIAPAGIGGAPQRTLYSPDMNQKQWQTAVKKAEKSYQDILARQEAAKATPGLGDKSISFLDTNVQAAKQNLDRIKSQEQQYKRLDEIAANKYKGLTDSQIQAQIDQTYQQQLSQYNQETGPYNQQSQEYNTALAQWQQQQGVTTPQQQAFQNIINSPATQALTNFGIDAINRNAASTGSLQSGRTLEQLFTLGQNIAATQISNTQDKLLQMTGIGAQAAGQSANISQALGAQIAGQNTMGAEAQANAQLAAANATAQGITSKAQIDFTAYQNGYGEALNQRGGVQGLGNLFTSLAGPLLGAGAEMGGLGGLGLMLGGAISGVAGKNFL